MANNRMYLVCDVCEKGDFMTALYIGKRMSSGYYMHLHNIPGVKEWHDFFDRHEGCGGKLDVFSIRYESPRDSI